MKDLAKRARAMEALAYVVSANTLVSIPEGQSTRSIATRRLADTIERLNTGQTRRR